MKTTKLDRRIALMNRLADLGFTRDEANQLRRIEMTLHAWAEAECNGEIERDETTGKPFRQYGNYIQANDVRSLHRIADREAGALKRLDAIFARRAKREGDKPLEDRLENVVRFHQTDPRGCALYIVKVSDVNGHELDSVYTRGVAVCD